MAGNSYECGKCGGLMNKGFIVDADKRDMMSFIYYHCYWVEGDPVREKSLFGGEMNSLDVSGRQKFRVMALRCSECGFLESYAV